MMHRHIAMSLALAVLALAIGCEEPDTESSTSTMAAPSKPSATSSKEVQAAEPYQPDQAAVEEARKLGRRDEFKQMIALLELEGDQRERFDQAVATRAEKLEDHRESDKHKQYMALRDQLKAAKQANDEKKAQQFQAKLEPIQQSHQAFMEQIRAEVLDVLTPAQKKAWTGYVLWERTIPRFGRAKLSDDQKARTVDVCIDIADEKIFGEHGDVTQTDPYLKIVYDYREQAGRRIISDVLTDEQKKLYQD